jgi:UDP:flavonoid glycosyltransferase YjiC (YdhE family)
MRILFVTRGSSGHVGPLVPFAQACTRAGHEVRVAAQEQFGGNVERAGLVLEPVDAPHRDQWMPLMGQFAQLDFQTAHELMIGDFFAGLDVAAELPRLTAAVERWRPDVMVRESWEFGSTIVAESHGVPMARVGLGLAEIEEESIALAAPKLDEARGAAGLLPDPDGRRLREAPYLTMVPESLDGGTAAGSENAQRFRYGVSEAPRKLPDWWRKTTTPLVYLTFGSVAAGAQLPYYPELYRSAIDALANLPVRLLVTVGDAERRTEEVGAVPPNVHVETWVPHDEATAAADAIVCHGGFGSTLATLAHGKPLVVLPVFSADQWANGEAVERVGAGVLLADYPSARTALALPSAEVVGGLADAVQRVLAQEAFRSRAEKVAASMRSLPPVKDAVAFLETLPNS